MSKNCDAIVIFLFYGANLKQFQSWIPVAWPVKLTFSLILTFHFLCYKN